MIQPTRRNSRMMDDRGSVADQPGRAVFLTGLIVSLVVGLALRGVIHPSKVQGQVEAAASRIHPDVKVHFASARVSLADGFLPELAVVIEKVRMESSMACWMGPRLFADEVRLPVSLSALILGQSPFLRIKAGEVELRLTQARPASCESGAEPVAAVLPVKTAGVATVSPPAVTLLRKNQPAQLRASSGEIESVEIQKLTIVSEVSPAGRLDLDRFQFLVRSVRPRVYQIRAQTHLGHDPNVGDYLSNANIVVEYKEFPEKILDLHLFGNWREGSYSLTGSVEPDKKTFAMEADVRHLALSQILSVLRRFELLKTEFDPRQSWLSFKATAAGNLDKWKELPLHIESPRMEGDLGEIYADEVNFSTLSPLKLVPARLQVKSLDLDRLLAFLKKPHPSDALNRLGKLRGVFEVKDEDEFRWSGEHTGLEFIFSNKGRREIQAVKKLRGQLQRKPGSWVLDLQRAEVDQGNFEGDVKLTSNEDFSEVELKVRAENLLLAPAVQKLMTRGGEIDASQAQLALSWKNSRLQSLKGSFQLPLLKIEGATLEKFQMQFSDKNGAYQISPRVDRLTLRKDSGAWRVLQPVLTGLQSDQAAIQIDGVSGVFIARGLQDVTWTKLVGRLEKEAALTSEGAWDASGALKGTLAVRGSKMRSQYRILGTRDEPSLAPESK